MKPSQQRRNLAILAILSITANAVTVRAFSVNYLGLLGKNTHFVPKPSHHRIIMITRLVLYSSLTDDGDFALVGLPFQQRNLSEYPSVSDDNEDLSEPKDTAINRKLPSYQDLWGLTEDGDFLLQGINNDDNNAVDPLFASHQALEKYETPPLVDANKLSPLGLLAGNLSPPATTPATTTATTSSLPELSTRAAPSILTGLTEDGDIAIPGFNVGLPTTEQEGESNFWGSTMANQPFNSQHSQTFSQQPPANEEFSQETTSMLPANSLAVQQVQDGHNEQVEEMTFWLLEIIPTLRDDDCIYYADELVSLGWDPNCVTASELQEEDLVFMKPLHRRFLIQQLQIFNTPKGHYPASSPTIINRRQT
jgi:hypothetical protein